MQMQREIQRKKNYHEPGKNEFPSQKKMGKLKQMKK